MKNHFLLIASLILCISFATAQTKPPSADKILKEAQAKAAIEHKNVFVLFHASWCGWCDKMEETMNDESIKKYFADNYIITFLTVYESKGKEYLENPGALNLLTKYRGNNQGIPYWLVFDKDGNLLADSKIRRDGGGLESGENSGCPAAEEEVANFVKVLKQTSTLDETELAVIEKRFRQNER